MSRFNLLVHLNAFEDQNASNNPTKNHFKWTREITGVNASKPKSEEILLAPGETRTLFNGARTLAHNNTTEYSLQLKVGTSNTYILKNTAGTAPQFRAARLTSADATTVITVAQNATVTTLTSTAGTLFSLLSGGCVVGDSVVISGPFNSLNRVTGVIIAVTATSFSIENANGLAETVTLSSNSDIKIFSSSGAQKGDSLKISGGFSPASRSTYEITAVESDQVEFYSTKALAAELNILTTAFDVYFGNKNLVYLESDKTLSLSINNQPQGQIEPFATSGRNEPAVFLKKSSMWAMTVTNDSIDTATVYYATIE